MSELWAALLISRQSPGEYLATFTLDSGSGVLDNMNIAVKNILGLPDKKRTFSVSPKPGKQAVCNPEGKNIIKSVNL